MAETSQEYFSGTIFKNINNYIDLKREEISRDFNNRENVLRINLSNNIIIKNKCKCVTSEYLHLKAINSFLMKKVESLTKIEMKLLESSVPENETIKKKSIVELYLTSRPDHEEWQKLTIGVVCLTVNKITKYHHMRIFSLLVTFDCHQSHKIIHSEGFYIDMYFHSHLTFCSFEGEVCIISSTITLKNLRLLQYDL
ncbi:hypothetical protein RF11_16196 [Thelohanellus kitauei]|uniref:Uncharacterized protein n=1 Tax=Thelohanellus kitauei TaxID=669202 RepID=A0A0C2N4K3_THEKT|nr:hypothetical protein RF11_16196 [Thelohanellus kitauei]